MDCIRNRITYVLFLAAFTFAGASAHASDRWETLQAINWVENPRNSNRVGPKGELGPYQFRLPTWRMHTDMPFAWAVQREHADEVAVMHYEWIKRGLLRADMPATVYNIALAWNAGLYAVVNKRAPSSSHSYAEQVTNLAEHLKARQIAKQDS